MLKPTLIALGLGISLVAQAQTEPLPDPLTLDYVLDLPAKMDPDFVRKQALRLQAESKRNLVQAEDGLELNLLGRFGQREFADETQDYHLGALHLGVPLFDFGRTDKAYQAWLLNEQAEQAQMQAAQKAFRLRLMQAYFNVLLADLKYRVENEAMAIAYVTLDKVRENYELKRVSDAELYQHEVEYQKAFVKRQKAQADLRRSRMLLANIMGRPDGVINKLTIPDLPKLPEKLLAVEDYLQLAVDQNPQLKAVRKMWDASGYRIEQAKAGKMPQIRADAWVGQLSSYPQVREGHWHAEVSIKMPLYDAGLTKSKVEAERAKRQQVQADLMALEQQVRETVTNLYFELNLLNVEAESVKTAQTFAEYNLDLKRGLYENELQADLGNAMVLISQSDYDKLAFDLKKTLLWAQMQQATGVDDLADYVVKQTENEVTP